MSETDFKVLVVNQSQYLMPFALKLTRDTVAAEDLFQDTYLRAITYHEKYHTGTNIKAWLYTIMRNIFINDYRTRVRRRSVMDASRQIGQEENRPDSGSHADSLSTFKDLLKAVHELPSVFKTPFQMYYEGYRYNEISSVLQEPLGTVKSRIHFARKLLKQQLVR